MNNIRRIQYFLFCLLAIGLASCSDDDNNDKKTGYEGILTELAAAGAFHTAVVVPTSYFCAYPQTDITINAININFLITVYFCRFVP